VRLSKVVQGRSVPRNVESNSTGSAQQGVPDIKYLLFPEILFEGFFFNEYILRYVNAWMEKIRGHQTSTKELVFSELLALTVSARLHSRKRQPSIIACRLI
jgi:hypothetical protein